MHRNDMQMRLCIVKLGVVSCIYGDFWESPHNLSLTGIYKGFLCRFWHTSF